MVSVGHPHGLVPDPAGAWPAGDGGAAVLGERKTDTHKEMPKERP